VNSESHGPLSARGLWPLTEDSGTDLCALAAEAPASAVPRALVWGNLAAAGFWREGRSKLTGGFEPGVLDIRVIRMTLHARLGATRQHDRRSPDQAQLRRVSGVQRPRRRLIWRQSSPWSRNVSAGAGLSNDCSTRKPGVLSPRGLSALDAEAAGPNAISVCAAMYICARCPLPFQIRCCRA
jgi:hypothetical protein